MNKILSLKIDGVKNFENGLFEFDFTNKKNARSNDGELFNINGSIYTHNVISLVGINSSGKSTSAKLLSWALDILSNSSINPESFHNRTIPDILDDNIDLSFIAYSAKMKMIFKYCANIKKRNNYSLEIMDDCIYYKKFGQSISKKDTQDFVSSEVITRDSVKKAIQQTSNSKYIISNYKFDSTECVLRYTDFYENFKIDLYTPDRFLRAPKFDNLSVNLLEYLDRSIDYIRKIDDEKATEDRTYELKFKNRDKVKLELYDLEDKLSTGTVRWISLFNIAVEVLKKGSYFVIDEIELSLHKSLSVDLIKLFSSKITNPLGATLIFTTHYTEILDHIKRTDSIYVTSKNDVGLSNVVNLSDLIQRNDLMKSDYYLKNLTKIQTAPSRSIFNKLVDEVVQHIGTKDE